MYVGPGLSHSSAGGIGLVKVEGEGALGPPSVVFLCPVMNVSVIVY